MDQAENVAQEFEVFSQDESGSVVVELPEDLADVVVEGRARLVVEDVVRQSRL